jgi:predicted permease
MPDWRREIRARLAPARLRAEREAEIVEEVAQHLDDRYRDKRSAGQTEPEAIAAAWTELETEDVLAREIARTEPRQPLDLPPPGAPSRGRWLTSLWQDLRFAGRTLRKQPTFTLTVVMALALSIGPTTAILSFGNWLLWRPLPGVSAADRLAIVWFGTWNADGSVGPSGVSYLNLADLRAASKTSAGFAGVQETSSTLVAASDVPRQVGLAYVTGDFFDVAGVRIPAGRAFGPDDDRPPLGAPVAIVSDALARGTFGSPAGALGQRLMLNRRSFIVIGVAPSSFTGIRRTGGVDVWITGASSPYLTGRREDGSVPDRGDGIFYEFVVRLAPGYSFTQLQAELDVLTRGLADAHPAENRKFATVGARVFPGLGLDPLIRPRMAGIVRTLLAIGGVLLLLGCANVANMLISRAIRREHEVAIRKALGAGHRRLVQLQLAESCLLAIGGATLGIALAMVLKQMMQQLLMPAAPGVQQSVPIDLRVLAMTLAAALVSGGLAALAPAWLAARSRVTAVVARSGGARTATRAPRLRSALAVVQLALSLTLIVGALLLVTTLRNLRGVDLGFDPANVTIWRIDLAAHGYTNVPAVRYLSDLFAALEPGSAGGVTIAQRAPFDSSSGIRVLPPGAAAGKTIRVGSNGIAHNYFGVLGTALTRGRSFTAEEAFAAGDGPAAPVVINETLARQLFGDADAVGRTAHIPRTASSPDRDVPVIGVVRDARWNSITGAPEPFLYQPLGRYDFRPTRATLIVRSAQPMTALNAVVRAAAARLDANVPLSIALPLTASIDRTIQQQRLFGWTLTWLSALAFVLAAVGLHGLVAQTTTERSREFGIRLALGASQSAIARLVARYVLVVTAAGTAAGLVLAFYGTRLIQALLFGVTALDPLIYAIAVGLLAIVVVAASAVPVWRAIRTEPVVVLRGD